MHKNSCIIGVRKLYRVSHGIHYTLLVGDDDLRQCVSQPYPEFDCSVLIVEQDRVFE